MHGDGTSQAITRADMASPRLLDLTRSLRRAGRVATGVDRVERAYLDEFLARDAPAFAIFRTALGYVLLDRDGMAAFRERLVGTVDWETADLLSRVPRGRDQVLTRAETCVRRLAVARSLPARLKQMLARHLGPEFDYYNVGHSNLTERVLRSVGDAGGRTHVLVHDVIPLEYPQFQRPHTVAPFRDKLQRVGRFADRVIYNSADTRRRTEKILRDWGGVPPGIVSHLGTIDPVPDVSQLPEGVVIDRPYFVCVGTIEPRKNHALLLDLWEDMGPNAPLLYLCGSRGWNNDAVFARLDKLPKDHPVKELPGLSDPALAGLVQHSAGSLFPSLAEGYGLPPVEARALGARVLCNDLPVLKEILFEPAQFVPVSERELWLETIRSWESSPPDAQTSTGTKGPSWTEHFKTVLSLT